MLGGWRPWALHLVNVLARAATPALALVAAWGVAHQAVVGGSSHPATPGAALAAAAPSRRPLAGVAAWVAFRCVAAWPAIGAWRDDESRIRRVAQLRPRDPDALLGLADLLAGQGRGDEARALIARVEAVSPGDAGPLVALPGAADGRAEALAERLRGARRR